MSCLSLDSYIKPQPSRSSNLVPRRCLSLDSYIKPQRLGGFPCGQHVVYLLIPTSNHNTEIRQTGEGVVVYLLIPTSNHNAKRLHQVRGVLFISWFLHQTTTNLCKTCDGYCCLSLDSYIKPQRSLSASSFDIVVYLLIPTSNHNTPRGVIDNI